MNRKQQIIAALAVFLVGVTGLAQAEPFNRYTTFQGALADVDGFDSGIAGIATYGVRVPEMHKNFAVEAEFAMTFIEPEAKVGGTTWEASYYALGAYGVYAHPLSEKFHVRGRLGIVYYDLEKSSALRSESDDDFDPAYGVGITVGLSKETRFILEYTAIGSDLNNISLGFQFKL